MKKMWMFPIGVFLLIVLLFAYYYAAVTHTWWPVIGESMQDKGQLGDSFGLITSLFSALAFGGVIFTLWYQHQTLQENKRDSDIKNFESILFNLLAAHNSIVQDIDLHNKESRLQVAKGRDCFYRFYIFNLKPTYKRLKRENINGDELELAKDVYAYLWARQRHNLGHYLRFLYNGPKVPE